MKLSLVIPCLNEELLIEPFYHEVNSVWEGTLLQPSDIEYVFVDDGSTDQTLAILKALADESPNVRYISFSRNFGKEAAIYAGLQFARGEYVATMDVDGQDPPEMLPKMYSILTEGENGQETFDMVRLRRVSRKGEPAIRSFFARNFYKLINRMSDTKIVDGARDYQMMNRKVVDGIVQLKEYNRFYKGISSWVGYKTKWLEYENIERAQGETKWSFLQLLRYAFEGILAFSTAPLVLASVIGLICFAIALVLICFIFIRTLVYGDPVPGWPSMICVILFIGSIQLLCVGILGQYLSRLYLEAKDRPIYLIETDNVREGD